MDMKSIVKNDKKFLSIGDRIKKQYFPGDMVRCLKMIDNYYNFTGHTGTVLSIDDYGQIEVKWDNNDIVNLIPDVDDFVLVTDFIDQSIFDR